MDLEKIKAKLAESTGASSKTRNNRVQWLKRLNIGQSVTLRILPMKDGVPFKRFSFHKNLSEKAFSVYCPNENEDEHCPICDYAWSVWRTADDSSDDALKEAAKALLPKYNYHSYVVVRGQESEGPFFWAYNKSFYEDFLRKAVDPEFGDFTDVEDGIDVKLEKVPKDGSRYGAYKTTFSRRNSTLWNDNLSKEEALKMVDSLPADAQEMSEQFWKHDQESLQEILNEYLEQRDALPTEPQITSFDSETSSSESANSAILDEFEKEFDEIEGFQE